MFKIEKGIAIPSKAKKNGQYPFKQMGVGDSFKAPLRLRKRLGASMSLSGKKLGYKFTLRSMKSHVRVWRIK